MSNKLQNSQNIVASVCYSLCEVIYDDKAMYFCIFRVFCFSVTELELYFRLCWYLFGSFFFLSYLQLFDV